MLVVVPARGGSKGIPLKNIRKLNGVPLVALVGRVVQELNYVDRAIVSTDHPEIAEVAKKAGLDAPFFRPRHISGDCVGDIDVLDHALKAMEERDSVQYDIILMLPPTSPLRRPEHVTAAISKLGEEKLDSVWTVSETDSKGHPLKQLLIQDGRITFYDERGKSIIARQQLKPVYHRNGVAYAMTRECILCQKTIHGERTGAVVISEAMANIDTEMDIAFAEFLLRRRVSDEAQG